MKIEISNIKVIPIHPKNGLVGFASFTLNKEIFVGSVGIHTKLLKTEYRLTYPQKNGKAIWHPITKECSQEIEKLIFTEYKNVISKNCNNDRYCSAEHSTRNV